jgi:hypothetical protein
MLVKDLFRLVQEDTATTTTIESQDVDKKLSDLLQQLEVSFVAPSDDADDPNRFEPLLGYNNVSYTLKARQKTIQWEENGPGQRGSRKTSRVPDECYNTASLPVNTTGLVQDPKAVAEAVNAITFDALLGLIRMTVILRGDAVPMADTPSPSNSNSNSSSSSSSSNKPLLPNLSNLAVRASLDPPRIVFGEKRRLININIGPTSSVVLDATYFDPKARIGMGGTSGTKFVFARCSEDDEEAKEFLPLLQRKPVSKRKAAMI